MTAITLQRTHRHSAMSNALILYALLFFCYFIIMKGRLGILGYYGSFLCLFGPILVLLFSRKTMTVVIEPHALVWAPFILVTIYHTYRYQGNSFHYVMILIVAYILIANMRYDAEAWDRFFAWLQVAVCFYGIGVFLQLLLPGAYAIAARLFLSDESLQSAQNLVNRGVYYAGFTSQVGHTAMYMLVGIELAVFKLGRQKEKMNVFFLIVCIVALLLQGKRAHILFLVFALLFTYFVGITKDGKLYGLMKIIMALILLFCLLLIFSPMFQGVSSIERLSASLNELFDTGDLDTIIEESGRGKLYDLAMELFAQNPWLGIGWGNFSAAAGRQFVSATSTHNIYLQLLCETGLIGLTCFILGALWSFLYMFNVRKTILSIQNDSQAYMLRNWGFAFSTNVFILLYGLTENPIYNENYLMLYLFTIILNVSIGRRYKPPVRQYAYACARYGPK